MSVKRISLGIALAVAAMAGQARTLPHAELVNKYVQSGQYKQVLSGCKTVPAFAPAGGGTGEEVACWAAKVANDLKKQPEAVAALVLNGSALDAALSRCKALSMEQRFKSEQCAAAGRADTFVSLRLPRTVDSLKPLEFK